MFKQVFYRILLAWAFTSGEPYDPPTEYLRDPVFQTALTHCADFYEVGLSYNYDTAYASEDALRHYYANLIQRYKDLKTFPSVRDYKNFPRSEEIRNTIKFQNDLLEFYKARAVVMVHQADRYNELVDDLRSRIEFYNQLYRGVIYSEYDHSYYTYEAREILFEIRKKVGYDNYYGGILLPPVNLQALNVLD